MDLIEFQRHMCTIETDEHFMPRFQSHLQVISTFQFLPLTTRLTTSRTRSRISSLLALCMTALAEIISATVHNNRASKHIIRSDELDQLVAH